jgi:hypothetical protein
MLRSLGSARNQRTVWLQQFTCFRHVRAAEVSHGMSYGVYVRVRTDMEFLEALPADFLRRFGTSEAAIPAGVRAAVA